MVYVLVARWLGVSGSYLFWHILHKGMLSFGNLFYNM